MRWVPWDSPGAGTVDSVLSFLSRVQMLVAPPQAGPRAAHPGADPFQSMKGILTSILH